MNQNKELLYGPQAALQGSASPEDCLVYHYLAVSARIFFIHKSYNGLSDLSDEWQNLQKHEWPRSTAP